MRIAESKPLREVADFFSGGTPSKANPAFWAGSIPWVSPKDMGVEEIDDAEDHISEEAVASSATRAVPPDTIFVVTRSGILARRIPVSITRTRAAFNQDIKAIRVRDGQLEPRYLLHFLAAKEHDVLAFGVKKGATVHSLISGYLEGLPIPLPPIEEQRRIAAVLDRSARLVKLHREAAAKTRDLIPALFIDMFGDPATNPMGWEIGKLSSLIANAEGGKNVQAGGDGDSPFRILKVSAATSGEYDERQSKPAPAGLSPPPHYLVRTGDLLFSRANTYELVGATAVVHETDGRTLLPDKLWRLVPRSGVPAEFLWALLQNSHTRHQLSEASSGTSGSMRNISQAKLMELEVLIPAAQLQQAFARTAKTVRGLIASETISLQRAEELHRSLLAEVFGEA